MKTQKVIYGGVIRLRQITLQDCNDNYVKWLNDRDVNQFLETRWSVQDLHSVTEFVKMQLDNDHSILFAIDLLEKKRHIGNIKIGPINKHYNHADISYFIGDKSMWRKGIATEAIKLICMFGFEDINLHKIEAGAYSGAVGSWKALERNGFIREAVLRDQVISEGQYMDVFRYGLIEHDYHKMRAFWKYPSSISKGISL